MHLMTFSIMGSNSEATEEIKNAVFSNAHTRLLTQCDDTDQLLADVVRVRPTAAIIILEANNLENQFDLIRQLAAECPGTTIITASRDASPAMILGGMRAGAQEFLQIPVIPGELQTVLERVSKLSEVGDTADRKNRRLIAVFSGKGGAGVSFLATNLAAAMNVPTLLADLNLQAGDAASFLGIEPRYSIADFVSNRARLDDALITSLITTHSANLSLLAAPLETHEADEIEAESVTEILHVLGRRFERIVLDLPHTFDPITIAALDLADDILLVMTLDIPGIRNTKRALKVFERLGYPRSKIHVVVNRWSRNIDVELQKVQAHIGQQFIGLVPNDYVKVMDSINLGQPHVHSDPASKITAEIKRIASTLAADHDNPLSMQPGRKSLRGIFGRRNSTAPLDLATTLIKT
jgi:pilus assembly protein CpaE